MMFWKFLRSGAVSPFSRFGWSAGQTVTATDAMPCATGFHACRTSDLPYWLNDELWWVELTPPVRLAQHKVVAAEAVLVSQVVEWSAVTAATFSTACVARTAGHAVDELSDSALIEESHRLAATVDADADPVAWTEQAYRSAAEADRLGARRAARLCYYLADAIEGLALYPAATAAYIAARTANHRSNPSSSDPYIAEREWQADWLATRLMLPDGPS